MVRPGTTPEASVVDANAPPERRPVIHHGTPMTPRAALLDVLPGRAGCVSFYRPDDVEAVEAVCPRIMFRQRRVQLLAGGPASRRGVGRNPEGLCAVLRLAGAAPEGGSLGRHPGSPRRAEPDQRLAPAGLAVRSNLRRSALAHERPAPTAGAALRELRHGGAGLDRPPEARACRVRRLPPTDGRGVGAVRQLLASDAHDARDRGGLRLPVRGRGRHQPCAERAPL